jgi:hypothetical protein
MDFALGVMLSAAAFSLIGRELLKGEEGRSLKKALEKLNF